MWFPQTLIAITHVSKEILLGRFKLEDMQPLDNTRMLVLSLGTGLGRIEEKYNAKDAAKWGLLRWVYNDGASPILDIFGDASSDMVDIHISTVFQSISNEQNYLRIQVRKITNESSSIVRMFFERFCCKFIIRKPNIRKFSVSLHTLCPAISETIIFRKLR